MQIEPSAGQGEITETNPKTGEILNEAYAAIPETKYVQSSRKTLLGRETTHQAVKIGMSVPAKSVMVGNSGPIINISMRIKPGNDQVAPTGFGEATGNKGKKIIFNSNFKIGYSIHESSCYQQWQFVA